MSNHPSDSPLNDPYRPPETNFLTPKEVISDFPGDEPISEEVDRTFHLPVEATIRTIGLMLMVAPVISLINIVVMSFSSRFADVVDKQAATANLDPSTFRIVMYGMMIFGALIVFVLGLGLLSLKNWARWIFIVFGIFGLCGTIRTVSNPVPGTMNSLAMVSMILGAAISLTQIFLLFLPGVAHVCSKHYQFVISTTRQLRPTLGLRDQILLGAFAVNVILGLVSGFV